MASRLDMKVTETQTVRDGVGSARGAVTKRGEGEGSADDGKSTNSGKPSTTNKKKRKNKWRKKKGKSGAAGVSSAAAANGPTSELALLLPDSAETTAPSEDMFEKMTNECQSVSSEQRGRINEGGGGLLEGDDDIEPHSNMSGHKLAACNAKIVTPSKCSRAATTTDSTLDQFSSKDNEVATVEVDEFQDFQQGEPVVPALGRQPSRSSYPAQKGDLSANKRQVQESVTTGSMLALTGVKAGVEGDQGASIYSTPARQVGVVEDNKGGGKTPEVKPPEAPGETEVVPWEGRLEAEEGVGEGDDVDDEKSLLLLVATDTAFGSSREPASTPQQPKAEKVSDAASDVEKPKWARSLAPLGEVGEPSVGRVVATGVVKVLDTANDAGEPKRPSSLALAQGLGKLKQSHSSVAPKGVGAGRVNVTSVVDDVDALLAEIESMDLSSPRRPRRRRNHQDEENKTPPGVTLASIWEAVKEGDRDGVEATLASGARIDETDSEGFYIVEGFGLRFSTLRSNALDDRMRYGGRGYDVILGEARFPPASVAARTVDDWTPLMIAGGGGRLEVVKELLAAGAGLWDRDRVFGSNPLIYMLQHGAQELLHSVNFDMWTPLMIACDAGSLETVRELADAGADLDAYNKNSLTSLDIAMSRNHLLLVHYLKGEGAFGSGEFWQATKAGDAPRVLRFIRANGHLVKALDKDGRTALFEACVRGHVDVARALVEAGADVNFRDSSGMTPLSVATVVGDVPLARYLAQLGGAKLSARNTAGWTPLMQAVAKGDLDMARFLVDRGAMVNDGCPDGDSVLDMAARFTHPEVEDYILSKGGFSVRDVKRKAEDANKGKRGFFLLWFLWTGRSKL